MSGLVGRMVGEDDRHCEALSAKGIGAVKTHRRTVEHHFDQYWSRSQLEAHHARWSFHSIDSSALPNWRRTCHNTHGNRAYSEAELDQGASIKEKLSDDFWKSWTKEYLLELRNFHEVQRPVGKGAQLRVGDVVLIQEDVRPDTCGDGHVSRSCGGDGTAKWERWCSGRVMASKLHAPCSWSSPWRLTRVGRMLVHNWKHLLY